MGYVLNGCNSNVHHFIRGLMASENNWAGTEPLPVHRSRICTLSMMLWTAFDSFPNTLTTQHAKYKWCAKRPAVCSQYTPHIDYNSVNNSQSGVHCSILIHGKLFSHFLLPLNTTLQYVKTYPTLCGQKYRFYFYTDFANKLYDF